MEQFTTIAAVRAWSRARRRTGARVGFVPTMGALHDGHLSLVAAARRDCDAVVASIYVNPTQFDNPEDLATYPRTLDTDLRLLTDAGCDAVFLPETAEMYPDGYCTFVEVVGPLTDKLCAIARPGHFRGVATVVAKLFACVEPDVAVFGQKDLQQALIIGRVVRDLNLGLEVRVAPTVRDRDGLALSSRNRRLSPQGRAKALGLPRGLELARQAFAAGERQALKLTEHVYNELLVHPGIEVDYCDVIDIDGFKEAERAHSGCVVAAAAFVDGVRLIDHIHLGGAAVAVATED
jgi:pantoate--beta-alanine ligase